MDKLRAMQVFVCVVEQGSLSAAAEKLRLSRAMVSRHVAELEQWSGARLLHRTTRSQSLTYAGEAVLQRCRLILPISDEITSIGDDESQAPRGHLRITSSQSLLQTFLMEVCCDYCIKYPQVKLDIFRQDKTLNLVGERIDLAIRITNQLDPSLIARRLGQCHSVLCAAPSYLAGLPPLKHINQLVNYDCLTYEYFSSQQWKFAHHGKKLSVEVKSGLSSNCATLLMQAIERGMGIALLPRYLVGELFVQGKLVEVLPDFTPETLGIYAVYASRRYQPKALRILLEYLVERFKEDIRFH